MGSKCSLFYLLLLSKFLGPLYWEEVYKNTDTSRQKTIREVFEFLQDKFLSYGTDHFEFIPVEHDTFFCDFFRTLKKDGAIEEIYERESTIYNMLKDHRVPFKSLLKRDPRELPPYNLWLVVLSDSWEGHYKEFSEKRSKASYCFSSQQLVVKGCSHRVNQGTTVFHILKVLREKGSNSLTFKDLIKEDSHLTKEKIAKNVLSFKSVLREKSFEEGFLSEFGRTYGEELLFPDICFRN